VLEGGLRARKVEVVFEGLPDAMPDIGREVYIHGVQIKRSTLNSERYGHSFVELVAFLMLLCLWL